MESKEIICLLKEEMLLLNVSNCCEGVRNLRDSFFHCNKMLAGKEDGSNACSSFRRDQKFKDHLGSIDGGPSLEKGAGEIERIMQIAFECLFPKTNLSISLIEESMFVFLSFCNRDVVVIGVIGIFVVSDAERRGILLLFRCCCWAGGGFI